ncbi:MAG: PEP-CTERM sorting domain-containing protein [Planctomycetia bacterium]|nr:PEP-CTERM sorting domain-containing protein [Planctomycetia bacterium]
MIIESRISRFLALPVIAAVLLPINSASAVPYAFYFHATWGQVSTAPVAGDALGRTKDQIWNAALGTPVEGVFIYDAGQAVDVTGTAVTPSFVPAERDYFFPSPNSDNAQTPVPIPQGINGYSYVKSNGKEFRIQASLPQGTNEPTRMTVVNNAFQPFGDPQFLPPPYDQTSDYWDSITFRSRVNLDPKNGPFVRQLDLTFIDAFSGGSADGSKAFTLPGSATDGSNSTVPPSIATADLPLQTGSSGWGAGGDGHTAGLDTLRRIAFGDTDGNGTVTASDINALVANYLKPAGTYQINGSFVDAYTVPADWLGAAIWTHGDYNSDGVVNLQDYKIFLNPGLISPGAPRNWIEGDTNFDHIVDVSDIQQVAAHYLATNTPLGDANADGIVDVSDIQAIAAHYLQSGPGAGSGVAVPEPASVGILVMGIASAMALGLLRRRRAM